jgi:hypothetical protein
MENKYFTPDIEDIHAGYECELLLYAEWDPITVKPYTALESVVKCIKDKIIRVPYLTKEQIEAEGWKETSINHYTKKDIFLKVYIGYLHDDILSFRISIYNAEGTLFKGECKDINTFRKLCKLLHI